MENGFLAENKPVRQALEYTLDRETAWNVLSEGSRFPADLGMLVPAIPASIRVQEVPQFVVFQRYGRSSSSWKRWPAT